MVLDLQMISFILCSLKDFVIQYRYSSIFIWVFLKHIFKAIFKNTSNVYWYQLKGPCHWQCFLWRSNICRCQMRENITSILNWPFLKVSLNISLTNHKEIRFNFFTFFLGFFFLEINIFLFTGIYVHNLFVCLLSKREYVCAVKCWLC